VGDKYNTLILYVDPTGVGDAILRNASDESAVIDGYEILSDTDRLTTAGWSSLDENDFEGANTWLEVDSSASQIGEVNQTGFTTLEPGETLNLGPLYLGGAQDLHLNFLLEDDVAGIGTAGKVFYEQFVQISVDGDYNEDGIVNAADYTVWRNRLGQNSPLPNTDPNDNDGTVTQAEYNYWKSRFGATSGSGSGGASGVAPVSSAVPEPTAWLLVAFGAIGGCLTRRRER
jgi:hypothetical protein